MNKVKSTVALLLATVAILVLPLLGSVLHFGGLPPGYGDFPSRQSVPMPGFNATVFWVGAAVEGVIVLFLLFPQWFGFQKTQRQALAKNDQSSFPSWFWMGMGLFLFCWAVFWAKIPFLDALDPVMSCPLWWGFTLMLDGWVYQRTGGSSLVSKKPQTVVLLALVSSVGWLLFEYLNFFVLELWFYPYPVLSAYGNVVWFLLCFTGIFPQLFVCVQLFSTFPRLAQRYSRGPRLRISRTGYWFLLGLGLATSFLMGLLPFELFFLVWASPAFVLWAVLGLTGTWTVFTPLEEGDWSPLLLSGIALVLCGLGWEFINFGSEFFFGYRPVNPSYWAYSIPYVNSVHLPFSQMPILGYMGYFSYAWICWLQWSTAAKIFGFDPSVDAVKETK